jgi:hypothetical protein
MKKESNMEYGQPPENEDTKVMKRTKLFRPAARRGPGDEDTGGGSPRRLVSRMMSESTNEELVDMLFQGVQELKRRLSRETTKVSTGQLPDIPVSFAVPSTGQFIRLPPPPAAEGAAGEANIWRIVLLSNTAPDKPIGIEIGRDAVIGRERGDFKPDIDLTPYGALDLGVSRRHAMLRPTKDSLLLADVGSSNGTFHNRERIRLGEPKALKNGDIISFGAMHLRVKIISRPGEAPPD